MQLLAAAVRQASDWGSYRVQLTGEVRADAHGFDERAGLTATHPGFKRSLPTGA